MASSSKGGAEKNEYDVVRDNNMRELREKFLEAFRDQIAEGTVRDPRRRSPTPPPRQLGRRSRSSGRRLTRNPVRRSARICSSVYASHKKPKRGFLGFPVSQFLRITKYEGSKMVVSWVTDEYNQIPEATEDLEFTFCLSSPIPLDMIPTEYSTPEMFGNGWKDGVEMDSDDDDVEVNMEEEDITNEGEPRRARPRKPTNRSSTFPILSVEDVTPALLKGICYSSNKKRVGVCSTCHQCRQKTSDTKSVCRSRKCHGLRGMFCGYCLKRRYGEDVAVVLLDPNWKCPPCRNLCNCSICRSRDNLRPTGILYPEARQNGFKCVADYLKKIE